MSDPSTFIPAVIRDRLGVDRLRSYLEDCQDDLERALDLYAWNGQIAAAFLEDLGRLEVVLRNRFDWALTELGASAGHASHWFDQPALFPGRHGEHALDDIAKAKQRAERNGGLPAARNKVIAELSFGFWRNRRALADDAKSILELAGWMCTDTLNWMVGVSRIPEVLNSRPA